MQKLKKLQNEYNRLYEKMGYTEDTNTIAELNIRLDTINAQMEKELNKGKE